MQVEQVYRQKWRYKKWWKYDESFSYNILIRSGLAKTLKSICQAPGPLIAKRGLICDHSHLVNIIVYFRRTFVYFLRKIFVVKVDTVDFRNFKIFNFLENIFFWPSKAWKNFKVNLPASCKSKWQKELNLWSH